MQQSAVKNIAIITSEDGIWHKEIISLAQEKWYSPWQWKRMYEESLSPEKREAMSALRRADAKIRRFADDLRALVNLLPKDPTRLADIALILGEVNQKLVKIQNAGKDIKDVRKKRLADFYGRFSVDIPKHLRTKAEISSDDKVANAGVISDFVQTLGRKIFEFTDPEIREMKRVISHLVNKTKALANSVDRHLEDMLRARQTGDIGEYINSLKSLASEQADFEEEYSTIYDAYLKEPYEQALASAEKDSYEKVVISPEGQLNVVEVPPDQIEAEKANAEEAIVVEDPGISEMAPDTIQGVPPTIPDVPATEPDWKGIVPSKITEEQRQKMLMGPESTPEPAPMSDPRETRQVDMDKTIQYDPELAALRKKMPRVMPVPVTERPSRLPSTTDRPPQTEYQPPRSVKWAPQTEKQPQRPDSWIFDPQVFQGGVGADAPSSDELDIPVSEEYPETQWDPRVTMTSRPHDEPVRRSPVEVAVEAAKYNKFLKKLDKIAETENKYIVAAFISKFSEYMENVDTNASINLLKLANKVDCLDKESLVKGAAHVWDSGKDYIQQKEDGTLIVDNIILDRNKLNAMNRWEDLEDMGVSRNTISKIVSEYNGKPKDVDTWLEQNSKPFVEQEQEIKEKEPDKQVAKRKLDQLEIDDIIVKHEEWVITGPGNPGQADFSNTNISGKDFSSHVLTGAIFSGANINGANFKGSNIGFASFSDATLHSAKLDGVTGYGAVFYNTIMTGISLFKASLLRSSFRGTNLVDADIDKADLSDADFRGATLKFASFRGANLANVKFGGADLTGAILIGADLTNVSFAGANLTYANLQTANSTGMYYDGTTIFKNTIMPDGTIK